MRVVQRAITYRVFWVYFDCLEKDCARVDEETSLSSGIWEDRHADVADQAVFEVQQARVSCPYLPWGAVAEVLELHSDLG